MKKHLAFWIAFPIGWTILSAFLIFYFDLANGPLVWFIFELIFLAALFVLRVLFRDKKRWVKLTVWGGFIVLTISVMGFSSPSTAKKSAAYYDNPVKIEQVLQLNEGQVQGIYNKDKTVQIYAGIQYAQAERWKEPQPYTWEGVRDGSYFGPKSMQPKSNPVMDSLVDIYSEGKWHPNYLMKPLEERSEENGLNLNIWRPNTTETNLPILVFIHGGSLTNGSSSFEDYNGESVAKKGVIMITIQYRLGVFGYFAHPDLRKESPNNTTGDYGLLDQIFALQWINNNASNFGGDKNNITIAGESAGSSSVSALCTSPLAAGLFKNAIGESSSLVMKVPPHTYRTEKDAYEVSEKILKEFKCKSIDELRKVPAKKLVETKYSNSSMMLDGYALPKDPYQVYAEGNNNEEALLSGYNVKEADAFVIPNYLLSPTNKKNINARIAGSTDQQCADEICELYKDEIEKSAFDALNEIMSIYWFIMPHHSWSNMALLSTKTQRVYRYQFTKENGYHTTYHSGEMIYAYGNLGLSERQFAYDESDYKLQDIMLNYWVNFAKNGNPNGEGLPTWDEYQNSTDDVMELGENVGKIPDKYLKSYEIFDQYLNRKLASM